MNRNKPLIITSLLIVSLIFTFLCLAAILLTKPGLLSFILGCTLIILIALFFGGLVIAGLILAIFVLADRIHYYATLHVIREIEKKRHRNKSVVDEGTHFKRKLQLRQAHLQRHSRSLSDNGC